VLEGRRLFAAGGVDLGFGAGGRQTIGFVGSSEDFGQALGVQPDGKTVMGGTQYTGMPNFEFARYTAAGALDPAFGTGGKQVVDVGGFDQLYSLGVGGDGKIIAVGTSSPVRDPASMATDLAVVRLNPDGSPDATFDGDGRMTMDLGGGVDFALCTVVQGDGKIVLVGQSNAGGATGYDGIIVRLNTDGSPDTTFGTGGVVRSALGSTGGWLGVTIDGSGRVVAVGAARGTTDDVAVGRFNADGTPDATFGTGGRVVTPVGAAADVAVAVRITPAGKIVVAGYSAVASTGPTASTNDDALVLRYNADGALDTSFGTGGAALVDFPLSGASRKDLARSLGLMADGRVVIGGASKSLSGFPENAAVARLTAGGVLDTSFNGTGRLVDTSGNNLGQIAVRPDGSILATGSGSAGSGSNTDFALTRYTVAGALDTTFGTGGRTYTDFIGPTYSTMFAAAVQPDGKMVGAGYASIGLGHLDDFALTRLDVDGSLDVSFGGAGTVVTDFGGSTDRANAVAVQADGKIVAAGYTAVTNNQHLFAAARYNPDGTLDTTFGSGGKVTVPWFVSSTGEYDTVSSVVVRGDGTILLVGQSDDRISSDDKMAIATLSPTGVVTGVQRYAAFAAANGVVGAVLDSSGRLVVGVKGAPFGTVASSIGVYRFTAAGALDASFGTGGLALPSIAASVTATGLAVQPDGRILLVATLSSASKDFGIIRLTSAGALDTSFDADGMATVDFSGASDAVTAVSAQSDGHVLVAGTTKGTASGSVQNAAVARLNADGSLDAAYGTAGRTVFASADTTTVYGMVVYTGGTAVLVGGTVPVAMPQLTMAAMRVLGDPVVPGAAGAGGPYTVAERGTVTLVAGGDGSPGVFEWDFDYDGATFDVDARGTAVSFAAGDVDGPASKTVAVRLRHATGAVGNVGVGTVAVTNAGPTGTFTNSGPVPEASPATVTFSNVVDAAADAAAGFRYSYDFDNDGTFEVVDSTAASATVPGGYLAGITSRVVRGRITDKDGGYTDYTTTIAVTIPANASLSYPSSVNEGGTAALTFAGQSGPGPYTYWFDYDNDGVWEVSNSATASATVPASYFADGPGSRTVLGRISGPGGYTDYGVTLPVNNRPPTVSLGSMPVGAKEGTAVTVTASATDPSPADVAAGFTFNWTVLRGGVPFTAGSGASFTFTPGDNGTYSVSVTATDKDGGTSAARTGSFTAANVAPTGTFEAPASVPAGTTTAGIGFSNPSDAASDVAAGFLYSFDFDNNGVFEIADTAAASATIPSSYLTGVTSRTVRGRIKDKDGGFTDYASTIQVQYPPPTATFTGGTVAEGSSRAVTFSGAAAGLAPYKYSYDFDNDGTFEVSNSTAASVNVPASYVPDGPATRVVRGRISAADGGFTDYTTNVVVSNVNPTATFSVGTPVINTPATLAFTNPVDPSPTDVAAGLTYSFDFDNNGTFEIVNSTSPTATLPASYLSSIGAHIVRGRISDKDGGFTDYPIPFGVVALDIRAQAAGTYTVQERSFTTLYDAGSSSNAGAIVSWEWDTDYNGVMFVPRLSGRTAVLSAAGMDGPNTRPMALRVTDAAGNVAVTPALLSIENVAPVLSATPTGPAVAGAPVTFKLGIADPSAADFVSRWVIDWGDGTVPTTLIGQPTSVTHTFPAAGTYVAVATVTDEDGSYTQPILGPGSVDPTFAVNGRIRSPYYGLDNLNGYPALKQCVQPDGKLLLLSEFGAGGTGLPGILRLSRYNPDGSVDDTFGTAGSVIVSSNPESSMSVGALGLQPDGCILVSGYYPSPFVARYTPAGAPDASFGNGGSVALPVGLQSIVVQPDGKILGLSDTKIYRFNANGSTDLTFGSSGIARISAPGFFVYFRDLAVTPAGKIVAGGYKFTNTAPYISSPAVAQFTSGGVLDSTFGTGGYTVTSSPAGSDWFVVSFLRQPNGGLLLAATFRPSASSQSVTAVLRYTAAGTLDPTFGSAGIAQVASVHSPRGIALQADGSVLVADSSAYAAEVIRLTAAGQLDTAFGSAGVSSMTMTQGSYDATQGVSVAPDGGILLTAIQDSTAPVVYKLRSTPFTVVAPPATATFSAPTSATEGSFTATVRFANPGGGGPYTYSYDFDNDGTFEISDSTAATATVPAASLADGPFTRTVHGRITGPTGPSDYTADIKVTNLAPAVSLGAIPTGVTELQSVTVSASATDPSAADAAAGFTFAWTITQGAATIANGSGSAFTFTPPDSGTYTVSVTAADRDGGRSSAASGSLVVSNVAPTAAFAAPDNVTAGAPAVVSFTAPADVAADLASLRYSYDFDNDGTFEITGSAAASATVPAAYLAAAGFHTVRGRVADKDGGFTDYTATLLATVVAPAATLVAPASVTEGATSATVSFANVTGSGPFTYAYDFDNDGTFEIAGSTAASATIPAAFLADGPFTRTVRGRITGLGGSADYTADIAVTNAPPSVVLGPIPRLVIGEPVTLTATATDPSPADTSGGFTFAWTLTRDGAIVATGAGPSLTFTPSAGNAYTVSVTATDKDAATAAVATATLDIAVIAPPSDTTAPTAALTGTLSSPAAGPAPYTFTVTYTDDTAINAASIDGADVVITGPGNFSQLAGLVSSAGSGASVTATYSVVAPGGSWNDVDNGTYTVALQGSAVTDSAGNPAAPAVLGSFTLAVPHPDTPILATQLGNGNPASPNLTVSAISLKRPTLVNGALVGGSVVSGSVTLKNSGRSTATGTATVTFYLSADATASTADTVLKTVAVPLGSLKAGKTKLANFALTLPAGVTAARRLVAVITPSATESDTLDNGRASAAFNVAAPATNLAALALKAKSGKSPTATLTVRNAGNAIFNRAVPVAFSFTDSATGVTTALGTLTTPLSLKPGQLKALNLKVPLTAALAGHHGILIASLDPANTLGQSSTADDRVQTSL
jgi:uncharacterized delta-60 repeat protein